jgi:hypoxanthine-DNA glycosylase
MREAGKETLFHPIPPVWDARSRVLILGSFPSAKSRAAQFFYGNPQNRFWRVLAAVLACPPPETTPEKKALLLAHGVALWDVIARCDIRGSADASIENAVPNDLSPILAGADIRAIYCKGAASHDLYQINLFPVT